MFHRARRTTPRVRDGVVQKKHRTVRSSDYFRDEMPSLVIDRWPPARGHRHLVTKSDLRKFIGLLPDWNELSRGLQAIVLDGYSGGCMGWYQPGVVSLCAWRKPLEWEACDLGFYEEHKEVFEKLAIPVGPGPMPPIRFTEASAKAFLLVHVFVHELGHHHDRMTTRSQARCCRGERYAEEYARHEDQILERYRRAFDY